MIGGTVIDTRACSPFVEASHRHLSGHWREFLSAQVLVTLGGLDVSLQRRDAS